MLSVVDFFILIIIAVAGIVLGTYFARKKKSILIARQEREKNKNKSKVLEFLRENEKATNNDIEELLGVSDATATRYFDELENDGKVAQIGPTGRGVYYILK